MTMSKVSNFDVMRVMSERDLDIRLSPLDNIINMQTTHKGKDTNVTIGVYGNIIADIMNGRFVGGLILADKLEFARVKAELEQNGK